jgi:outer membrane protein assembly factor BamB
LQLKVIRQGAIMKRLGIVAIVMLVVIPAFADVIEDSGIKGGIIVQVECKDAKSLASLLVNEKYLVHGLDVDAKRIARIRDSLRSNHLYGKVSAAVYDGKNLPYTDNLVNLLVIEDSQCKIQEKEILRVLVPGGVAMVCGKKTTKPVPSSIDEWTHFLHGADNNAVVKDTVVAAPRTIQWVSNPRWARSHEEAASVSALVSAKGRIFAIMDEAPNVSIRFMAAWKLVARDAFNGTLLWKKEIPVWSDHLRHFRAGPTHLPRRLVAVGDKVYVTLGLDGPVSILDAATGDTLKVLKGTERTEEIVVDGGVVYLAVGTSEVHRRGGGLHERGEPKATDFRYIMAVDGDSGRHLWKKDFTGTDFLLPMTLTVRNGSVFYQDINGVGRLDARTGKEIWEKKRQTVARRMSFASPTIVATDDVLLVADRIPRIDSQQPQQMAATDKIEWGVHGWNEKGFARRCPNLLVAYSVKDGKVLWSKECSEDYNSAVDIFVVGDKVHIGTSWDKFDLRTGVREEGREVKMTGGKVGMAHHRCYRNKASVRYVFTGRSGIEVADMEKGWLGNNSWIRGACQYGIMPANGMLYAPPDACGCFNKVKVQGFFAVGPARENKGGVISDIERLEKGPAYGKISDSQAADDEDWPMYRRDGQRSGGARTTVSRKLKRSWSKKLRGRLTQPAIVSDTVYIAETDSHTIYALSVKDGREIYKSMVLFGSADGCVYSLRAKDGVLVWKFLAAPEIRLVSSYGQLESVWPVHGSVLIQNDAIYTSAGRNTYLDDGITFYKLNPMTGSVLNKNVLYNFDPETGAQLGPEGGFDMDGVNTDILSGDGENVFMKQERLDGSLQKGAKDAPHLFGVHGFLGEEWFVRSYWLLGTNVRAGWGAWASGNETTFGRIMTFDDESAYGYGRVRIASAATGHKADDYQLYGVKKVQMITGLPKARRKKGQKDPPPAVRRPSKPEPFWADEKSLIVRAMALTSDKLVVAGPPDLREKKVGILAYSNEEESLASFKGEKGVMLRVVSTADGRTVSEQKLDAMPVFDGMSAARGRVFVSLKNGEVQCWD